MADCEDIIVCLTGEEVTEGEDSFHRYAGSVICYVIRGCRFCKSAKQLLIKLGIEPIVIDLGKYPCVKKDLMEGTNKATVPQIFFNEKFIGGYDDLLSLQESGGLDEYLKLIQEHKWNEEWPPLPLDEMNGDANRDGCMDSIVFVCEPDPLLPIVQDMRGPNGVSIRSRRYRLKVYKKCFVGQELVTWLVSSGRAPTREAAIALGNELIDHNFFHHVCRDHPLRDGYFFYRFLQDERCKCLNKSNKISTCDPKSPVALSENLRTTIREVYSQFLSEDGRYVDYEGFSKSDIFSDYLEATASLHRLVLEELSSIAESTAFWINIYNALVIHSTAVHGPPSTFMRRYQFFNKCAYRIGSYQFTLNDIVY